MPRTPATITVPVVPSGAITVPVMDGALKPNRAIDQAERVAELPGIDDLAVLLPPQRPLNSALPPFWIC